MNGQTDSLRLVLRRAINANQLIILSNVKGYDGITSFLDKLSERFDIPVSTLRLNAKILRSIGLIDYNRKPIRLTEAGKLILKIINSDADG